ncbi:Dual specificity protein phosphatase 1 [Camellia lanceoleosa]|uniref:Dual specificity protein phosphatase 1 n=1 Tax=Camellia lanceoleosa TaxID=1840588 RepID=A0ACC0G7F5_9ERIC|nr:Dual specificity protein phosphatase 1 [Camellia lanceoleosa]
MNRIDEIYRERIAALWRAMYATRCIRDDSVPCQIEEGLYLGSVGGANNKSALKSLNQKEWVVVCWFIALLEDPEGDCSVAISVAF